uniref:Uncharacterized protein n=1 Tax=Thermomicrobium roseum TaxID=500 RepID=A0A7C2AR85_THERO
MGTGPEGSLSSALCGLDTGHRFPMQAAVRLFGDKERSAVLGGSDLGAYLLVPGITTVGYVGHRCVAAGGSVATLLSW